MLSAKEKGWELDGREKTSAFEMVFSFPLLFFGFNSYLHLQALNLSAFFIGKRIFSGILCIDISKGADKMPKKDTLAFSNSKFSQINLVSRANSYFAASNTAKGFTHDFEEIFRPCKRIYILKGGPGTGKSSLIRAVASEATNRDIPVEYFYCSSDTSSLDGVIIGDNEIAVIDGTSPHTVDPKIPGVKEEIINLGQFWNSGVLKEASHEIKYYLDKISSLYAGVYDAMAVADSADGLTRRLVLRHTDSEKLHLVAERTARAHSGDTGIIRPRGISAFGVHGHVILDCYERLADEVYTFRDKWGISGIFLDALKENFEKRSIGFDFSRSPIFGKTDAILLRNEGVAFLPVANDPSRIINTERFILKSISVEKDDIKELRLISSAAVKMAEKKLSLIGELHDELEKIYISAMDFKALGELTKRILISIFKNPPCQTAR